jgi:hypothetical protein
VEIPSSKSDDFVLRVVNVAVTLR